MCSLTCAPCTQQRASALGITVRVNRASLERALCIPRYVHSMITPLGPRTGRILVGTRKEKAVYTTVQRTLSLKVCPPCTMHRHQSIAVDGQSITFQLVDKEKGSVASPLHVVMTILIITQAQWISHTYSSICSDKNVECL